MADKKISELDAITGANTAADDYFIVVDTSGSATKKISRAELNNAIEKDVLSSLQPGIAIEGSSSSDALRITQTGSGNALLVEDSGNPDSTPFVIDSSGNAGIGTSSPGTYKLYVQNETDSAGAAYFHNSGDNTWGVEIGSHTAASETDLVFTSNSVIGSQDSITFAAETDGYWRWMTGATSHKTGTAGASEVMRIESSGNVGIGTTPQEKLHVAGDIRLGDGAPAELYTNSSELRLGVDRNNDNGTSNITFYVDNDEKMRIDSSGNVGIGTSSPGTYKLYVQNATGSAGAAYFHNSGVNAWGVEIGSHASGSETDLVLTSNSVIGSQDSLTFAAETGGYWRWMTGATSHKTGIDGASEVMRIDSSGVVRPGADNSQTLGSASYRWSVVYAGTGTINTSDEREKQQIANLDDAERRVAVAIKGLVKKYKYNDAVELKGDDARIHVGVIAQEVIAAFAAEGLDATRYALLCHDTWEAEPEETDEDGNVTKAAREAGERYGIRYDELLAFMIAAL
ncbi:MAG: tail fiber domain-containing protein [Pelagibacteraceae bacterium]